VSIERKARRIPNYARQVKLATGKGGLVIHGGTPSKLQMGGAACVNQAISGNLPLSNMQCKQAEPESQRSMF
jgi:hypothetical protein